MATFGIDLGTTYSCVSRIDRTGKPEVVKNEIGEDATPSVVYFESPTEVVVGVEAKNAARGYSELVVSLIKRRMGEKGASLDFHGATYTPESISAIILRKLVAHAARATGETVRDVVLTVPAYFGVAEREATRIAGEMADLKVINLVPEPVAAALYYGALVPGQDRNILVYDLGGGTFDTTVISMSGQQVRVVCTDGDHKLGGADWDEKIQQYLLDAYLEEFPDSGAGDSEEFVQELGLLAEEVKKQLSGLQTVRPQLRFPGGGSVRVELSRSTFEAISAELLERTMIITERTIETARGCGVHRIDEVLLVGGSTRMRAVMSTLQRRIGLAPRIHEPDLAVAKGAAMFALVETIMLPKVPGETGRSSASVSQRAVEKVADEIGTTTEAVLALADRDVTIVVPRAFGVKVVEADENEEPRFVVQHLLHANTPLPAPPLTEQFYTASDGQKTIAVEVYEQAGETESGELYDNNLIGQGLIERLPPLPHGSPIDITFQMDQSGVLTVQAKELVTGQTLEIELRIGDLTPRKIADARRTVARLSVV